MQRYDRICSAVGLIFAGITIWQSSYMPMGRIGKPGPGFMPFWVAVLLALLAIFLWIETSLRKAPAETVQFLSGEGRWSNMVLTAGSLLVYSFLMDTLGFIVSTVLLLFFLFRFIGNRKWWVVLASSALVTMAAHAIFKIALKVQLPSGLFRI